MECCDNGFHGASPPSRRWRADWNWHRLCPKEKPQVLTEPCNFPDNACNLIDIACHRYPFLPARGNGKEGVAAERPQDVSIRGIYARCRSQLAARRGSRD